MKKKMKRFAALGLAVVCALCGCTGNGEKKEDVGIKVEEVVKPTVTPEQEEVPLGIHVSRNYKTYYFDESEAPYLQLQYCDVTVDGTDYENLKRMVETWSMNRNEELRTMADGIEVELPEDVEEFYGYHISQSVSIARADERIVSLLEDSYQYMGGNHAAFYREGVNFDAKTGRRLVLKELITDYENFSEKAFNYMVSDLEYRYPGELFEGYEETVKKLWTEGGEPQWYVDATGIVIVLQEDTVASYAIGTPEVHLPYSEFEYYMKEIYHPAIADGVARLEKNQELQLVLKEGAKAQTVVLKYENDGGMASGSLWMNQQKQSLGEFASLNAAYLIKSGEEVFCMVETDMASDDFVTYIFRLTEGIPQRVDQIEASIDAGNLNAYGVVMESWVYLLGTYSGIKNYTFDKKEGFCTEEKEFRLHRNEFVLITTADLPVTLNGEESILPAGSRIVLNATDGDTYVKFTIQGTGQIGVLKVKREGPESYGIRINGMDENECFEMLPYAG